MQAARARRGPLVGFVLVSSANQMAWLTFAPLATGAAHHYGTTSSTIGLLSEMFPLLYVLGAVPASRALEKSFRAWLATAAMVSALGTVVRLGGAGSSPGTGALAWVMAGQLLAAAAQPLLINAVVALASRYMPPEERPTGIAIGSAGTFLGFVLAFVTDSALGAAHLGALLVIGAVYAGAGAVLLVMTLATTPCPFSPSVGETAAGWAQVRRTWADPVMRGLGYLVFVGFGVFVALVTWAQPLLKPSGVSASETSTLLTLMMVGGVATCAAVPPFVARHGKQLSFLVAAGVAAIIACLLMAARPGLTSATIGLLLTGVFLLPGMPVMLEVAERASPVGPTAGAGLIWLSGNAGGIVVAVVVGAAQGAPRAGFCLMALVILLAVPAAMGLRGLPLGAQETAVEGGPSLNR